MKKIMFFVAVVALFFATSFTPVKDSNWTVKEGAYKINFEGGKVKGSIGNLKASIRFNPTSLETSKIQAVLDLASLTTDNSIMTKHAKSALDAEVFTTVVFESLAISQHKTMYELYGKLTMKGVTKEIVIPFTFKESGEDAIVEASFSLVPKDYNITRMGTPNKIDITIFLPVTH